ncbi:SAM-dependent methyltransferase [Amycolatopsis sp. H20-H5]|uniref:SAM-dependent methyltransferase n=1 Tax=Amycolatopsis sp. H20-H5 TaxID=3046309 RepID=UPI002DBE7F01|nr:SAM-dependent methyltransferase [Amycolatopsis sp. H20-H5]MEC3977777.1 SAM-dependent methyltransferase [Amycolatopsis sp. H20-H5]
MLTSPRATPVPPFRDPETPNPARVQDWALGGSRNTALDRTFGEGLQHGFPLRELTQDNHGFRSRAVRYCLDRDMLQVLDLGAGLNLDGLYGVDSDDVTAVLVDHDPVVIACHRTVLEQQPRRQVSAIEADLRDPAAVLAHPALVATLDLTEPVLLLLTAVGHHLTNADDPRRLIADYVSALAPGSYLALTHLAPTPELPEQQNALNTTIAAYAAHGYCLCPRDSDHHPGVCLANGVSACSVSRFQRPASGH